jgi:hypothetical protein
VLSGRERARSRGTGLFEGQIKGLEVVAAHYHPLISAKSPFPFPLEHQGVKADLRGSLP